LIGWAIAEIALYWAVSSHNGKPMEMTVLVLKSLPFIAGVVVLIKARALAEWVSDFLDN
jgi:hypothetical protein